MRHTKNTTPNQIRLSINSLRFEIRYIFKSARKEFTSHKDILNSVSLRIYQNQKYITLPNYMKAEIKGYIYANFDFMQEFIEFGYFYDGVFIGKKLLHLDKNFKATSVNSYYVYKGTQMVY